MSRTLSARIPESVYKEFIGILNDLHLTSNDALNHLVNIFLDSYRCKQEAVNQVNGISAECLYDSVRREVDLLLERLEAAEHAD